MSAYSMNKYFIILIILTLTRHAFGSNRCLLVADTGKSNGGVIHRAFNSAGPEYKTTLFKTSFAKGITADFINPGGW
jgi:hypothetical protein